MQEPSYYVATGLRYKGRYKLHFIISNVYYHSIILVASNCRIIHIIPQGHPSILSTSEVRLPLWGWTVGCGLGGDQVWCSCPIVAVRTFNEKCPLNSRARTLSTEVLQNKWISQTHCRHQSTVICAKYIWLCTLYPGLEHVHWLNFNWLATIFSKISAQQRFVSCTLWLLAWMSKPPCYNTPKTGQPGSTYHQMEGLHLH